VERVRPESSMVPVNGAGAGEADVSTKNGKRSYSELNERWNGLIAALERTFNEDPRVTTLYLEIRFPFPTGSKDRAIRLKKR
jgi:hypothetical protein